MAGEEHLSLTQLQSLIRDRLGDAFPLPLWVVAEISELKVNYSGHCYLELVEKGGRNQVPKAKAAAVIWRSTFGAIDSYFRSMTGDTLGVGMKVLIRVSVIYHELYGMSLQVSDIDPRYTLGDMERQRQVTIAQLREDGVYDMNRELEFPAIVQRIAVVSSRNAAGYQDFINELSSSVFHFDTVLFDAFMQGHGSEDSIIAALDRVLERLDDFDALVIIRGGGSQSDLGCFDSYRLCSHIAQFPLPVIAGIGHDKDQSVADMVAAISLKTPTAVAGYLVDGLAEVDSYLEYKSAEMASLASDILQAEQRKLKDVTYEVSASMAAMTRSVEASLQRLTAQAERLGEGIITRRLSLLDMMEQQIRQQALRMIENGKAGIAATEKLLDSRRSENILSLGFSIVRSGGSAVMSAESLDEGAQIEITFARGSAEAEVKRITKTGKI